MKRKTLCGFRSLRWNAVLCAVLLSHLVGEAYASKPWPKQLKGISSVKLYVHLPPSLVGGENLAAKLRSDLEALLTEAEIDFDSPSVRSLAVDVRSLPYEACGDESIVGIRILVRLSEPVVLARDPLITEFDKLPIVWYEERVFVTSRLELNEQIRDSAVELVGLFAGWVKIQR